MRWIVLALVLGTSSVASAQAGEVLGSPSAREVSEPELRSPAPTLPSFRTSIELHIVSAAMGTTGLGLLAMGAGAMTSCVSANGSDCPLWLIPTGVGGLMFMASLVTLVFAIAEHAMTRAQRAKLRRSFDATTLTLRW